VLGVLTIFGAFGAPTYFKNFTHGRAPFFGGFDGFVNAMVLAGFSFIGTEFVGMTAAESEKPEVDMPKAIRQSFWRILLFYVSSIFVVCCVVPYDSPNLLGANKGDVTKSPFTLVLAAAGIPVAKHIMNAVVLSAVVSSGNTGAYTASRMLYSLALNGHAPGVFKETMDSGIPIWGLLTVMLLALVAWSFSFWVPGFYEALIVSNSVAGFISWTTIVVSQYRFRQAYIVQGNDPQKLPYKAPLYPFGPSLVAAAAIFMICIHDIDAWKTGKWGTILIGYIHLVLTVVLFVGYKVMYKTKIIPDMEVNLTGGLIGTKEVAFYGSEQAESASGRLSSVILPDVAVVQV
jgi:lysine-specific permease